MIGRTSDTNEKEIAAGLPPTPGYRYASLQGDHLYVAGQVPNDATGDIVGDDAHTQTLQCFANLDTILGCYGFDRSDIQRLVIYVVGEQNNLTTAWQAVTDTFSSAVPPATLLGVARLGYPTQLVEVDATVVKESA